MSLKAIERTVIESDYWGTQRRIEVGTLTQGQYLHDKSILNIGAGRTNLTEAILQQTVKRIVNIDCEDFPNLDLRASATELPFDDNEFDITVFLRVLHHINNFRDALNEALRCTKPGGQILISEPYALIAKLTDVVGITSHPKNIITKSDIEEFVKIKNLKVKRKIARIFWYYYGFQIQV